MTITVFELILLCLASFRLTRLVVFDRITSFIRKPFIEEFQEEAEDGTIEEYVEIKGTGVSRFFGELLSCYWCTGFWSTLILFSGFMLFKTIFIPIIIVLAIAGCAGFIEVIVQKLIKE